MENIIELLPPNVANKIAAGEVVDRPVSVVKELLENSLDADSDSIIVEIKNGGKALIRVTDNGSGIRKEYMKTAFLRHATSKIKDIQDLDSISTLGFRGEALASIAAVSKVELTSRSRSEDVGFTVTYHGSNLINEEPFGCPYGTTVVVKDLFYNTPARLKFLKRDNTESALVTDLVSKISIAYPNVKIRLINNGKILFSTTGRGDIFNNILSVFDPDSGKNLIKFYSENEGIKLTGFVSPPDENRKNRKGQIFFVNGRVISSKLLEEALEKAYEEKMFEGRYPVAYLFLEMDPETLDVNIHPNKKEVRFGKPDKLKELVTDSVLSAINNVNAIPEMLVSQKNTTVYNYNENDIQQTNKISGIESYNADFRVNENLKDDKFVFGDKNDAKNFGLQAELDINKILSEKRFQEDKLEQAQLNYDGEKKDLERKTFKISELRVVGTVFNTYIVCQDAVNMYVIDQHAAHERVFYEKFMEVYNNEEREVQTLLHPFVVNVSFASKIKQEEWFETISNSGFIMEDFGDRAFIVKGIPLFMEYGEGKRFLEDILQSIDEGIDIKNSSKIDKLIMRSCKSAVKAHDVLSDIEIRKLLEDLDACEKPYSCPHGRPTFIKFAEHDLEKMFRRIV